jgi:cold shock CspA family protein
MGREPNAPAPFFDSGVLGANRSSGVAIGESTMKYFGTVKSFDEAKGEGSLKPASGGADLDFKRQALMWDRRIAPTPGQRLSYELNTTQGQARAVNLQTV